MEEQALTRTAQLQRLNRWLLNDMPQYKPQCRQVPGDEDSQWKLFRSLVNVREPRPVSRKFLAWQDHFLQEELQRRGVTDIDDLVPLQDRIYLWQGDITTLRVDAVVNAANSGMTGCYYPCHECIDNAVHTFAGVQLRQECAALMEEQGFPEPAGRAKITGAYNLPCRYVIHTVGPVAGAKVTADDCRLLASCYRSCLDLARRRGLGSIAFCCISTGEFHFPKEQAAGIAVQTVKEYLSKCRTLNVLFNVFTDADRRIYCGLLGR